jgi:ABC-2 type transport system permease protein
MSLREVSLTGIRAAPGTFQQTVPGYAQMFVLLAAVFGTAIAMHEELGSGTLARLLIAPRSLTWILTGKLLVRVVVGVVQLLALLVFGHFVFGISLGPSLLALLVLAMAIVFPTVGLGLFAAGVARTREQAMPIGLAFVLAFSCLGGLWWPPWVTPLWMQNISSVVFTTWAMQGMQDLMLRGRGLEALPLTTSVLAANGIGLTALGLVLFRTRFLAR